MWSWQSHVEHAPHTDHTSFCKATEFSICHNESNIWSVLCKQWFYSNTCGWPLNLQYIALLEKGLYHLFVSFIFHLQTNRKMHKGGRVSHIHTKNVWMWLSAGRYLYNSFTIVRLRRGGPVQTVLNHCETACDINVNYVEGLCWNSWTRSANDIRLII